MMVCVLWPSFQDPTRGRNHTSLGNLLRSSFKTGFLLFLFRISGTCPLRSRQAILGKGLVIMLAAICLAFGAAPTYPADDQRANGFYEDAVKRLDRRDLAGAIIQLKNALQDNPSMLAAHVLIGRAFLENFQPEGAEISFERAIKLGIDRTEVAVPLAQALLMQGKAREVL